MNYYPFHIGDYASATRHLSWDEDAAFRRLLDVYYTTEKPLPLEPRAVFRLVMATTSEQRQAVETVLEEFFIRTENGWVNRRADVEIAAVKEKQQKQRDKANKRWDKQKPERVHAMAMPRHVGGDAAALDSDADAMPPTPTPTPTPTPRETLPPKAPPAAAGGCERDEGSAPLACSLMRSAGVARVNPSDPRLLQLLSQGVTPRQLGDLATELREAGNDPQTAAYVLKAMERRLQAAATICSIGPRPATRAPPREPSRTERTAAFIAELTGRPPRDSNDRDDREVIDVQARRVR